MLRGKMQQGYKEQLHEQQGVVAELRKENRYLMEVSCDAALLELVELCLPPMSAKFHSILSPFLFCPVLSFGISEQALRLAVQNLCSHDTLCFTVLYEVRKHVCFTCSSSKVTC